MSCGVSPRQRASRLHPCPKCGRADWCFFSDDGTYVVCGRVSDGAIRRAGEAGWLHRLDGGLTHLPRHEEPIGPSPDFESIWRRLQRDTPGGFVGEVAHRLGVGEAALRSIGCARWGGNGRETAAFPMMNPECRIVGVRLRGDDGRKWCIRGSRQGLFIAAVQAEERVVICEGPTDTAALLTAGIWAIGRPSCNGCEEWTGQVTKGKAAIILADADGPGRLGAAALAKAIWRQAKTVRLAEPLGAKDARDWIKTGSREELLAALDNAERYP